MDYGKEELTYPIILGPFNLTNTHGAVVARLKVRDYLDVKRMEVAFESYGNADNAGTVDVQDDGTSIGSKRLTYAEKGATTDIPVTAANRYVDDGSEITVYAWVAGTSQALNNMVIHLNCGRTSRT